MGAREELTSILRDAAEAAIAGGLPVLTYEGYADASGHGRLASAAQGDH